MKPLFIGYGEDNEPISLTDEDLETHVHGVGASRTGKSKLIEWLARELIWRKHGFCLIDPHGHLYWDLVRWLTWVRPPNREIILFNPSSQRRVVGFNPFHRDWKDDEQREAVIDTLVSRRVRATLKVWGQENAQTTPRLKRWLEAIYHTLLDSGYSLEVVRYLYTLKHRQVRDFLIQNVRSESIRDEWDEIEDIVFETRSRPQLQEFYGQVESARSRLTSFVRPQQVRRVMGLSDNNIDVEDVIESGKILLVNLQPSEVLDQENAELLGTLLLNEIWEVGKRRKQREGGGPPDPPFFLILDEFQKFLIPDIPEMLNEAAKYGLHLFLFHQHLSQLQRKDEETYGSMINARTKIVFGGLSRDDARTMVGEIFPGQVDMRRVKFEIWQTKFWPVYTRERTYSRTQSAGRGHARSVGAGAGTGIGTGWNPVLEEWVSLPSEFVSASSGTADSDFESFADGELDVPFLMPEPFKELSSVTSYTLEETLWEMADRLMEQYQRHFFIRRPGKETIAGVTPFVRSRFVSDQRMLTYGEKLLEGFLSASQVDASLEEIRSELLRNASSAARGRGTIESDERDPFTAPSRRKSRAKKASRS